MSQWNIPKEVNDLDMEFGPKDLKEYLPAMSEIPENFKYERGEALQWIKIANNWFFSGIQNLVITPKIGIDRNIALRHLKTIMSSYEPSHEHKIIGVAWLMSLWFDVFEYQKVK